MAKVNVKSSKRVTVEVEKFYDDMSVGLRIKAAEEDGELHYMDTLRLYKGDVFRLTLDVNIDGMIPVKSSATWRPW